MGQRADEAERDVARQRELISERLEELNSRVRRDFDQAGERLREQVSTVRQQLAESTDRLPGKRTLEETVPEHPLTSVIGGFGLGVALGMLRAPGMDGYESEGRAMHDGQQEWRSNGRHEQRDDAIGLVDRLSSVAVGAVMGPLQERLGQLAEEAIAGFMDRSADGRPRREDRPSLR